MYNPTTRRWLAGLGVVGALVAAAPASPASAEKADTKLGVYFANQTFAPGSPVKYDAPILFSSEPAVLQDLTVRYDFSELAGKVTITQPDPSVPCSTPKPTVLVCTSPTEVALGPWGLLGGYVGIAPTEAAEAGDTGKVKVTVSATGARSVTRQSRIRIGESVDLAVALPAEASGQPGATVETPLTISNLGTNPIGKTSAIFFGENALRAAKKYSNCTYDGDLLRTCHFDQRLKPGVSYRAPLSYVLGADTYAPGSASVDVLLSTRAEYKDFAAYLAVLGDLPGEPGTEGTLTLVPEPAQAQARGAQADPDQSNNWASLGVRVTGENGADLAAIGDSSTGAAGDTVTVTVGFRNNGPASLDYYRRGASVAHAEVSIPPGTSVVTVPASCTPKGESPTISYLCPSSPQLPTGTEETMEFTLRVDEVIANATGKIEINWPASTFKEDLNPANDSAPIVVNATGGSGGGGGEGGGGGLPVTGASTGLVTGVGGLLLVAGVGGFVLARRRRTRFVA